MKTLIMLLLLSNWATGQMGSTYSMLDSTIYYVEVYQEVDEWIYENKGNVISRELKPMRYVMLDGYLIVYHLRDFPPLDIETRMYLREGVTNALRVQFDKGSGMGWTKGQKIGWQEAKDDSGAKALYTAIAGLIIGGLVTYGVIQMGSER